MANHLLLQQMRSPGIKSAKRFIQNPHRRMMNQSTHYQQFLLHALGIASDLIPNSTFKLKKIEIFLDMRLSLCQIHLIDIRHKIQVFHPGQPVIQIVSVGHISDQPLSVDPICIQPVSGHHNTSFIRIQDACHHFDGRCLPGTVWTNEPEQFPARNMQRQIFHCPFPVFCVGFCDMLQFNHGIPLLFSAVRILFRLHCQA